MRRGDGAGERITLIRLSALGDVVMLRELIQKALAALPRRSREAFILHRFDGLGYNEVAGQMRISPKTVEKHIARAMFQLRKTLSRLDC